MTLNELIDRAAAGCPDAGILQYWDSDKQEPTRNPDGGDTLAEFVVRELADTYSPDASDHVQLITAHQVMRQAARDLMLVANTLNEWLGERKAA